MPLLIKSTLSIKNSRRYILWRSKPACRSLAFKYREAKRYILFVLGSPQRKIRRPVCCWREEALNSVYCNIHILRDLIRDVSVNLPTGTQFQVNQVLLSHQDEHNCAFQYKYMRHSYNVHYNYKDNVSSLSKPIKSKIGIVGSGQYISSGIRGKKNLVPAASLLSAMGHDVSNKGSITPSVILNDITRRYGRVILRRKGVNNIQRFNIPANHPIHTCSFNAKNITEWIFT